MPLYNVDLTLKTVFSVAVLNVEVLMYVVVVMAYRGCMYCSYHFYSKCMCLGEQKLINSMFLAEHYVCIMFVFIFVVYACVHVFLFV